MAGVHEGADEGGQHLLAFFYSNPLVYELGGILNEVDPLDYEEERRMIEESLSDLRRGIRFCSEPATVWNVQKSLNNDCKMLHFIGHACPEYLSFEDGEARRCGIAEYLNKEGLKELFESGTTKPELVFLASCHSQTHGDTLAHAGVPHVVAVESEAEILGASWRQSTI
ncbi:unnamed protein product [Ascophyllum nodosum]